MFDDVYQGSGTLRLSHGEIRCLVRGRGPAVLLVHGIPLSMLTWRRNIDELSRRMTVVAFDLRGFGNSSKGSGDYSPAGHARVISQMMEALELSRASLVGSSYGCVPAVYFATAFPEKVHRLVLINSVAYPGGRHSAERLLRIGALSPLFRSILRSRKLGGRLFAARFRKSYSDPASATPELINRYLELLRKDRGEESFLETLRSLDLREVASRIPNISQPTLILWGDRDKVLPLSDGRRLHKEIAGSRLEILSGFGHFPHEEDSQRVNGLIGDFLLAGRKPVRSPAPIRAGGAGASEDAVQPC